MKLPKRGEKGFTLIELLIVVAILGVLAAVVIPNVGRFMGAGSEEAAETELANIQTAVISMMTDNGATSITGVATSTNDMNAFPDTTTTCEDKGADADFVLAAIAAADITAGVDGYLLWGHQMVFDIDGDGTYDADDDDSMLGGSATTGTVKYVGSQYTTKYYTCDNDGTVHQHDAAGEARP